jgi:DNA topoisomerase-1
LGIPKKKKKKEKRLIKGYDAAAKALNNTRTVCRTIYVHPIIEENYRYNSILAYFNTIGNYDSNSFLSDTEKSILKLLNTYSVNLKKE